jgi:hypothetical protein
MLRAFKLAFVAFALLVCVHAEDKPPAFILHVTHVKTEDVSDKPRDTDCKNVPCTVAIVTAEAHSAQIDFVLECKQWALILGSDDVKFGKCWGLEAAKAYTVTRAGRNILFYDDTPDTSPLFVVIEETERKNK